MPSQYLEPNQYQPFINNQYKSIIILYYVTFVISIILNCSIISVFIIKKNNIIIKLSYPPIFLLWCPVTH